MESRKALSVNLKKMAPVSGVIALVILSSFVSWKDVWLRFREVDLSYLLPSTLFNSAFVVAEVLRLRWILGYCRLERLLRIFSISRLIGIGTVHLAGEGLLFGGLKLSGVSFKSAATAIVQLRCLDLGVLCLTIGLYGDKYLNTLLSLVGALLIFLFLWKRIDSPILKEVVLGSLLMYVFFALSVLSSAKAVGIDIGKTDVIRVGAVGVLSQILPLTPLGLGTRDLSLIALLSSFGVSREKALVFSWIEFIVVSLFSLGLLYVLSLIWERLMDGKRA
jgi:uncharacterized membrane protein YbhN (UPF0104 family)